MAKSWDWVGIICFQSQPGMFQTFAPGWSSSLGPQIWVQALVESRWRKYDMFWVTILPTHYDPYIHRAWCHYVLLSFFKESALGRFFHRVAMSVYGSVCLSPFHVNFFEASHWPLDPGPLIIGPGTTIRATISALLSAHYHLRYHRRYHPRTIICALPSAHYHLRTTIFFSTRW